MLISIRLPLHLVGYSLSTLYHTTDEIHMIGATDDGMGTVTLLSLIEQFAKNPPLRTTLFNLNNGEEDGLCGSQT